MNGHIVNMPIDEVDNLAAHVSFADVYLSRRSRKIIKNDPKLNSGCLVLLNDIQMVYICFLFFNILFFCSFLFFF